MDKSNNSHLVLIGAICGDIIGSAYERVNVKNPDFKLFTGRSRFTDDTVCSIAVADSIISGVPFFAKMQYWCRKYPSAGYGGQFRRWITSDKPMPYNSWGNGSAMRVSSVGAYANSIEETLELAKKTAEITHNHPEGIKGAQATALAIFLALHGFSKNEIKDEIETIFGYNLSRNYYDIQRTYRFGVSCQGSVPESIIAFLTASDYESTIRLAVALGGDADTQGAIAGGIAAAYYGNIPNYILEESEARLPSDIKQIINEFDNLLNNGR